MDALLPGTNLSLGQKVTAVILHIDILSTSVHVSILPKLLIKKKSVSSIFLNAIVIRCLMSCKKQNLFLHTFRCCLLDVWALTGVRSSICVIHLLRLDIDSANSFVFSQLNEGSKYAAVVQHIDKDFAVISLADTAQLTVIQTSSHLNDVFLSETDKLKLGKSLSVEVVEPSCEEMQGLPLVVWKRNAQKRVRTTSENQIGSQGHRFGEIVQGKVRTVKPTSILVTLEDGSTGSVHVSEVLEVTDICPGSFPTSFIKVGSVVTGRVIGGREASSRRYIFIRKYCHFKLC